MGAVSGTTPRKRDPKDIGQPEQGVHMRKYQAFLERRIQECMEESKRHLAKYSDLR